MFDRRPGTTGAPPPRRLLWCLLAGALAWTGSVPWGTRTSSQAAGQEVFGELRESVRSEPPRLPPPQAEPDSDGKRDRKSRSKRRRPSYFDDDCDDADDTFWNALLAPLVGPFVWAGVAGVTSPFWGPAHLVEDHYDRPSYFPRFPYDEGVEGYMMRDPWVPAPPRMGSLRMRTDYTDDFDAVSSVGGHILWETSHRWGMDGEVRYRQEDLGAGRSDALWMGDTNLVFRFAQSPRLQMRAGVGLNWMADRDENDFGVNFTYGGDWYPVRPLIVSAELDLGRLGRATYFHGRLTGGLKWRRYEVFTGYEYLDVGTVQIQGLVSGVRLWY